MTPSGCCTRYYSTWKSTIGCCRSCDVDAVSHKSTIDIHSRDSHFTQEMAWWWRRMMMGGPRGGGGVWRRNTFEWCIPRDSTKLFMTVDKICIIRYAEHASPDCKRRVNALITLSARCLVCRENSTPTHPPTPTHTHTRNITIFNMWEDKKNHHHHPTLCYTSSPSDSCPLVGRVVLRICMDFLLLYMSHRPDTISATTMSLEFLPISRKVNTPS